MITVANGPLSAGQSVPVVTASRMLELPRSTAYYKSRTEPLERRCDPELTGMIYAIIQEPPAFGVRRVWTWLRFQLHVIVNRKTVHRIMGLNGWTMRQRRTGGRPRVEAFLSIAEYPHQRWTTDIAMANWGDDGRCAFVPVIDCCTGEVLG